MGIVNVSPESFSGDGLADVDAAVAQALRFVEEGADILDVGGQSTRPRYSAAVEGGRAPAFAGDSGGTRGDSGGARGDSGGARGDSGGARGDSGGARGGSGGAQVDSGGARGDSGGAPAFAGVTDIGYDELSVEEEIGRVVPVIRAIKGKTATPISVDTYKAGVAEAAIEAGASIVNDVWGLKRDVALAGVAASHGTPLILMHNQEGTRYTRLIPDIVASLRRSVAMALAAGVARERIIVDPGFGFGKTVAHNLEVLRRLGEIKAALGLPLLLGTSRKSTIGRVLDLPVDDRVEGTAATVALGIAQGADIVRVHDVREMARVTRMADAVARG